MTLPGSSIITLFLLAFSLICWGSWANSVKLAGPKWRFELFYFDFAAGVLIAAVVIALTFGSLGLDGFTVMDDLRLAGKRQDLFAFVAGCIFNLANILLVAAISLGGMTVAYPVCFGISIFVGTFLARFLHPEALHTGGNSALLWFGCAMVLVAVAFDAVAWKRFTAMKIAAAKETAAAAALASPAAKSAKGKKSRRKSGRGKVLFLALIGGLVMGAFLPLTDMAKEGENGIGPYTLMLVFALGIAFSTFVCNLFFMNLPLQGEAVEFGDYFQGSPKQHLMGVLGGIVWCSGAAAWFVASSAEGSALTKLSIKSALTNGVPVVGALWGLVAWKEFDGGDGNMRLLLGLMLVLLVAGVSVIAVAH